MDLPPQELGCSKCRYSRGGCARCRNPAFGARAKRPRHAQHARESTGPCEQGTEHSQQGAALSAALLAPATGRVRWPAKPSADAPQAKVAKRAAGGKGHSMVSSAAAAAAEAEGLQGPDQQRREELSGKGVQKSTVTVAWPGPEEAMEAEEEAGAQQGCREQVRPDVAGAAALGDSGAVAVAAAEAEAANPDAARAAALGLPGAGRAGTAVAADGAGAVAAPTVALGVGPAVADEAGAVAAPTVAPGMAMPGVLDSAQRRSVFMQQLEGRMRERRGERGSPAPSAQLILMSSPLRPAPLPLLGDRAGLAQQAGQHERGSLAPAAPLMSLQPRPAPPPGNRAGLAPQAGQREHGRDGSGGEAGPSGRGGGGDGGDARRGCAPPARQRQPKQQRRPRQQQRTPPAAATALQLSPVPRPAVQPADGAVQGEVQGEVQAVAGQGVGAVDPRLPAPGWVPPASPYGLVEEVLYGSPWRLLLACMLLNKTSAKQVRQILGNLFSRWPTPEAMQAAVASEIEEIIRPLGLFRKRALSAIRFSEEFLSKQWTDPRELHGIGKYAADAYYMFCRGQWRDLQPDDKDLKRYHAFLLETGGAGMGLEREQAHLMLGGLPPPAAAEGATAAATVAASAAATAAAAAAAAVAGADVEGAVSGAFSAAAEAVAAAAAAAAAAAGCAAATAATLVSERGAAAAADAPPAAAGARAAGTSSEQQDGTTAGVPAAAPQAAMGTDSRQGAAAAMTSAAAPG